MATLRILFENVFHLLKNGGKFYFTMGNTSDSLEEQRALAEVLRFDLPLKSNLIGEEPIFVSIPFFHPMEAVKEGKVGNREAMFDIQGYFWTEETVFRVLKECGFINTRALSAAHFGMAVPEVPNCKKSLDDFRLCFGTEKP